MADKFKSGDDRESLYSICDMKKFSLIIANAHSKAIRNINRNIPTKF